MPDVKPFEKRWDRYGLSEEEWKALSPEERVIHYNRNLPGRCDHKASLYDWPVDLRESYSFDPYFHTAHLKPCIRKYGKGCDCQTCAAKIGIPQ